MELDSKKKKAYGCHKMGTTNSEPNFIELEYD
jgi:hypothetical protein